MTSYRLTRPLLLIATLVGAFFPIRTTSAECLADGTVISLHEECINDGSALVVNRGRIDGTGWQYAFDSRNDGIGGYDDNFNIYGIALKQTSSEVIIAFNGRLPVTGYYYDAPMVPDKTVNWGDLFIDASGLGTFQAASAQSRLVGIRFLPTTVFSDSGAPVPGLYLQSSAKSVVNLNAGHQSLLDYETQVLRFGGSPSLGDLPYSQTYYEKNSALNSIATGAFAGSITPLTRSELAAAGYQEALFGGPFTIGFKFAKSLVCDTCGVFGGDGSTCPTCSSADFTGPITDADSEARKISSLVHSVTARFPRYGLRTRAHKAKARAYRVAAQNHFERAWGQLGIIPKNILSCTGSSCSLTTHASAITTFSSELDNLYNTLASAVRYVQKKSKRRTLAQNYLVRGAEYKKGAALLVAGIPSTSYSCK